MTVQPASLSTRDAASDALSDAEPGPRLVIDRDALARNFAHLSNAAPDAETAAVVKADAYGLGAAALAPRLAREGCRSFFVATAAEGAQLRRSLVPAGGEADIYVLNGYRPGERRTLAEARLTAILNSQEEVAAARADGWTGPVALHVDTGMNRLGVRHDEIDALDPQGLMGDLDLRLVLSHFACADERDAAMNAAQRSRFEAAAARFPGVRRSLANTAGVLLGPMHHFDMTRPGVGLYGGAPGAGAHPFEPVARIAAPVLQLRQVGAGESIGYGADYVADTPRTIATVALGYADGLPRAASDAGYARIEGTKVPLTGRISMDLCAIDVTGLEARARPGAMVSFLGEDLDAAANAAGTIPYELLTRLGRRFSRVYEGAP